MYLHDIIRKAKLEGSYSRFFFVEFAMCVNKMKNRMRSCCI